MKDLMTSWVKGWMLGKYDKFNELCESDNFYEWIDGYQKGLVEIAEYEYWDYHLAVAMLKHPQLYFIVQKLYELEFQKKT